MSAVLTETMPVADRRRWPWYLLLFLASWLIAAIALLPLSIIRPWLHLPPTVTVHQLAGTVWNGSAIVSVHDPAGPLPALTIHGGLKPLSLLRLRPEMFLVVESAGVHLTTRIGLAKPQKGVGSVEDLMLQLSDVSGQISAVSPWVARFVPFALGGRMTIQAPSILLSRFGPWQGKAGLDWDDATLDTTRTLELGRFQATATVTKGQLDAQIHSVAAQQQEPVRLNLSLKGDVRPGAWFHLAGTVGTGPGASETLREQIRLIDRPASDGLIHIRQRLRP